MRCVHLALATGVLAALGGFAADSLAQQMTIATPFQTNADSFFERMGLDFALTLTMNNKNPAAAGYTPIIDPATGLATLSRAPGSGTSVVGLLNVGNNPAQTGLFAPDLGIAFRQGSFGQALPQFGGMPNPSPGLGANWAIAGPRMQLNFGLSLAQGNKRSSVTQTPVVTTMNGQPGFVYDTSQTPFVISAIPVLGGLPVFGPMGMPNSMCVPPLAAGNPRIQEMLRGARANGDGASAPAVQVGPGPVAGPLPKPAAAGQNLNPAGLAPPAEPGIADRLVRRKTDSAGRAAPSVAEARRLHQQEQDARNDQLEAVMERARAAEEDGKPGVAKIYYQRVAREGAGPLRQQALERLDALHGTSNR